MEKRGQISVEYIMIIVLALLILIPGIYMFKNYAYESNERIMQSRLSDSINQVIQKANKMYYYGPPSRSIVTTEIPEEINKMYILNVVSGSTVNETYIVFSVQSKDGKSNIYFDSKIPLKAAETVACEDLDQICTQTTICECFPERYYQAGMKNYKIEATSECNTPGNCVVIKEISPDLK